MVDGGTPEVDSMAEVEGSRPGDDRVGHASVEDACESRSVEAFESSQQDEEHHETEANDEIEEAGDDEEQSSDEEERESDALAERAKASGGVTSFIVSTDSTEPRAMPETGVANVVEPPREDDDWEAVKCDAVKADVKEAPIRMPSAQTCTMRGQVHDQGRMSGRWGMTREALDNLSQTSAPPRPLASRPPRSGWSRRPSIGPNSNTGASCRVARHHLPALSTTNRTPSLSDSAAHMGVTFFFKCLPKINRSRSTKRP